MSLNFWEQAERIKIIPINISRYQVIKVNN